MWTVRQGPASLTPGSLSPCPLQDDEDPLASAVLPGGGPRPCSVEAQLCPADGRRPWHRRPWVLWQQDSQVGCRGRWANSGRRPRAVVTGRAEHAFTEHGPRANVRAVRAAHACVRLHVATVTHGVGKAGVAARASVPRCTKAEGPLGRWSRRSFRSRRSSGASLQVLGAAGGPFPPGSSPAPWGPDALLASPSRLASPTRQPLRLGTEVPVTRVSGDAARTFRGPGVTAGVEEVPREPDRGAEEGVCSPRPLRNSDST